MQLEEMILVSIDDHVVEPPDMFVGHVPEKYKALAPKVVRSAEGWDNWEFQGQLTHSSYGFGATAGWPKSDWEMGRPGNFEEVRPGTYDLEARIDDMNACGVLTSMCFPTMPGFNGRLFLNQPDKELSLVILQAYNDWYIDEWCEARPGRFIPQGITALWDIDAAVGEVKRLAERGCRAITFPEAPHALGLPSVLSGYWDPFFRAMVDCDMVICLHIGSGRDTINLVPEAGPDHDMVLATQISVISAHDYMIGPIRNFPGLRVAMSEGGTGWVPFYLDRLDRHYKNQVWRRLDFGGKLPSEVFKEHFLTCFITDPSALKLRYDIGVDTIAWELDYPHSDSTWPEAPEFLWAELQHAGVVDREEIDMITWKNAARFFRWDPFQSIPKDEANVGALRKHATNVDTTLRTRAEYVEENTKAGRTLEVFAGRA